MGGNQDVDHASGSAFAGESSSVPARRNGRGRGADDRAPPRRRPIAGDSAERSHHDRTHRRRQHGRWPRSRLPQDAGRPDPRHLRRPSRDPRTRAGRGQSAVRRFEMRRASRFPRAAGAAGHRCRRHRHRRTLASAHRHRGGAPREAHLLREAAQRHAGRRSGAPRRGEEVRRRLPVGHAAALECLLPTHGGTGAERLHRRRAEHHDRHRPAAHGPSRSPPRP